MNLASLGVPADDEQVYRSFLRDPGTTGPAAAVDRLVALGLLHRDPDGRITAADPHVGLDQLIETRIRQASAARTVLPSLLAERVGPQQVFGAKVIGADKVQAQIDEVSAGASECLATQAVRTDSGQPVHDQLRRHAQRQLDRGMTYRTIVHRSALDDPVAAAYFHDLHAAGDRHRVLDAPVQQLLIFDRATAFLPTVPDRPWEGALMITQPGVVATLVDLFEQTWARAVDLTPEDPHPSAEERELLRLLNQHGKDEVAARVMGVSVRTFRGRLARLMTRLGAGNRFQAGVRAKERGWL